MISNIITNIETNAPVVALTFDDGPHPVYTPKLLKVLEKHNAKATFFLVGEAAQKYPEIVNMTAKAGHDIGNHSWNHANLTRVKSRLRRLRHMWKCSRATAPHSSRLFRPPYGAQNKNVQFDAFILGYKLILWNVSAQDWQLQDESVITEKIIKRSAPGNIFLLHDAIYRSHLEESKTQYDRDPMLAGLDNALEELKEKYRFISVSEILKCGKPVCNWPINNMI